VEHPDKLEKEHSYKLLADEVRTALTGRSRTLPCTRWCTLSSGRPCTSRFRCRPYWERPCRFLLERPRKPAWEPNGIAVLARPNIRYGTELLEPARGQLEKQNYKFNFQKLMNKSNGCK
jgi:hypothetical protein